MQSSQGVKTIEQCINSDSKPLAAIRRDIGEDKLLSAINLLLVDFAAFYSVGRQMGVEQIKETARLIVKNYYYLKVDDLNLFFDQMKSGEFGQTYDRIDGNVILANLKVYSEKRMALAEELNIKRHEAIMIESEKKFIISTGSGYVREVGDTFEEVEKREMASCFTFGTACKLKDWIVKDYYSLAPSKVKIEDVNKPKETLLDYLEHHKPELLTAQEKYKRKTTEYFELKQQILSNNDLDGFQKENAIRALAGIEPLTIDEYNLQNIHK